MLSNCAICLAMLSTGPQWETERRQQEEQTLAAQMAAMSMKEVAPEKPASATKPYSAACGSDKACSSKSWELRGFLTSTVPHLVPTLDALNNKVDQGLIDGVDVWSDVLDQVVTLQEVSTGLAGGADLDSETKEALEYYQRQVATVMDKLFNTTI